MRLDDGDLRRFKDSKEAKKAGYIPIPDDLNDMADKELGENESTRVYADHPLRKEMIKRFSKKSNKLRNKRLNK